MGGVAGVRGTFDLSNSFYSSNRRRRPNPRYTTSTTTSTTTPTTAATSTIEPLTNGTHFSDASGNSTESFDHDMKEVQIESCNGTLTLFTKTYNRGEEIEITEDIEIWRNLITRLS